MTTRSRNLKKIYVDYLRSVSVREKVSVNFFEFFYTEMTTGAVLKESFIPFLNFGIYIEEKNK